MCQISDILRTTRMKVKVDLLFQILLLLFLSVDGFNPHQRSTSANNFVPNIIANGNGGGSTRSWTPIQTREAPRRTDVSQITFTTSSPVVQKYETRSSSSSEVRPDLSIDIWTRKSNNQHFVRFVRISNNGLEDEVVSLSVYDSSGLNVPIVPREFPLGKGATAEIPLPQTTTMAPSRLNLTRGDSASSSSSSSFAQWISSPSYARVASYNKDPTRKQDEDNMITVLARGKRESVKRSFFFGDQHSVNPGYGDGGPFCVDRDVKGTCRYRDDPVDCFKWEWSAYATILNQYGPGQAISSIPEGLFLTPGEHGRVRVYTTVSCCVPSVQFISTDLKHGVGLQSCVVDVRELQNLHPGEIVGIVLGVLAFVLLLIIGALLWARRRRKVTINKVHHANSSSVMLPKGRNSSRTPPTIPASSVNGRSNNKDRTKDTILYK